MRAIFVRHPQTSWNENGLLQGVKEGKISRQGQVETKRFVKKTRDLEISSIYYAANKRCEYFAEQLVKIHPDTKLKRDSRINERSFGIYEGKSEKEIGEATGFVREDYRARFKWRPAKGESLEDISFRIKEFLRDLKRKEKDSKTVFVVTSGGVMRVILFVLGIKTLEEVIGLKIRNLEKLEFEF